MQLGRIVKEYIAPPLLSKCRALRSLGKELCFYKRIFSLGTIIKGSLIYFLYAFSFDKNYFSPLTINFLITSRCNFKCNMCSYSLKKDSVTSEISGNNIERFLNSRFGFAPFIFFSGGEPFVREDMLDILAIVKRHGIKCGVNTNGYLLDSLKIKKLIGLEPELIVFSLHGPQKIQDAITGVEGSYDRVTENILSFCKSKRKTTKVILSCSITKANLDYLEEVPPLAKRLGVDAVKFEHLNFISSQEIKINDSYFREDNHSLSTLIDDFGNTEEGRIEKLIDTLRKIKQKYRGFVLVKPDLSDSEVRNWYADIFNSKRKCFFIWHSIFVRPDGAVIPCQFMQDYELGNIKEDGLREIFSGDRIVALRGLLRKQLLPECLRCCKL